MINTATVEIPDVRWADWRSHRGAFNDEAIKIKVLKKQKHSHQE